LKRVFIIILYFILTAGAVAQQLPDVILHQKILRGIDLTLQQKYPEAKNIFLECTYRYPEHPAGYLYYAATLQAEYSDYESGFDRRAFDSLLAKAQLLAEGWIEQNRDKARAYYFLGTALAYRSFSLSEEGDWYRALMDGLNSAKMFERSLEFDTSFYNAMCGLGTYYYWRSKKTETFSWLPFLSDRKNEGINMLMMARDQSTYERSVALSSLMWIYIEEQRYDEALQSAAGILQAYPDNRSVLWGVMTANERKKDSVALLKTVHQLLESVEKAKVRNIYAEVTCRIKLASAAFAKGDRQETVNQVKQILRYTPMRGKTRRDIGPKLDAALELLRKNGREG
jgi:tetratricopeptide (TPR) repeat protein